MVACGSKGVLVYASASHMSILGCEVSLQQADGSRTVTTALSQRLDGFCQLGASSSVACGEKTR